MTRTKKLILSFLLVCTFIVLPSSYVQASDLGIKAGDNNNFATFHEILQPNQSISKYIEVVNSGERETGASIIAKDGLQSPDGSYTFIASDEPNKSAGNWYSISKPEINLKQGGIDRVDFDIKVPNGTAPGEYGSSLAVVEKVNEQIVGNIRIVNRNGIRNLLVVTGQNKSDLKLGNEVTNIVFTKSAETGRVSSANFEVKNVGNLFSKSEITYDIRGPKNFSDLQRFVTDIGPTDKVISLNTQLKPANWIDGGYTLTVNVSNTPVNRKLTEDMFTYAVRVQKITFTFDMREGQVTNLKIAENDKRADTWNASWWKNEYWWVVGAAVILLVATVYGLIFIRKKKKLKKILNKNAPTQNTPKRTII